MPPSHPGVPSPAAHSDRRRPTRRSISVLILALAGLAMPATLALARGRTTRHVTPKLTLTAARNAKLGATIVVDAQGQTLYALSGETVRHLKCSSALCVRFWVPLTVGSAHATLHAGAGVHGTLGEFRRPDGSEQVTLRGLLLYRFVGDQRPGSAAGEGVSSFGGVWHAVTAAATRLGFVPGPTPVTSTSTSTSTSTTSTAAPGYVTSSSGTSTSGPGQSSSSSATSAGTTSTATTSSPPSTSVTSTTMTTTSSYTYPYGY